MIKSSLTRADGTKHLVTDRVAYSHNWASTLLSVRVSGQEVSACNQYNHLAHTVKMRQMVDEIKLNTNYRDAMDHDIDFTRRLNRHTRGSDDGNPEADPTQGGW